MNFGNSKGPAKKTVDKTDLCEKSYFNFFTRFKHHQQYYKKKKKNGPLSYLISLYTKYNTACRNVNQVVNITHNGQSYSTTPHVSLPLS